MYLEWLVPAEGEIGICNPVFSFYMARAQRLRADYKNRFLVSLRKKGTRTPVLCFVLLLRFERDKFRKTKGATPPR